MPSSHCTILARFFTRQQVLINRWQMPEIGGKWVLVHASDNQAVWIIKDAIWGNRRGVADVREIFGMLNIWSCRRFTITLCAMISDWKLHRRWPSANERQRYRAEGSSGRSYIPEYQYFNRYMYNYIIQKQAQTFAWHQHNSYCKIIIYLSLQNTQSLFPASPSCIICFSFCSWKSAHR